MVKEMSVNILGFVFSNFITLACSSLMTETQWRFPLGKLLQRPWKPIVLMLS